MNNAGQTAGTTTALIITAIWIYRQYVIRLVQANIFGTKGNKSMSIHSTLYIHYYSQAWDLVMDRHSDLS